MDTISTESTNYQQIVTGSLDINDQFSVTIKEVVEKINEIVIWINEQD
jgi:hypothetical protein